MATHARSIRWTTCNAKAASEPPDNPLKKEHIITDTTSTPTTPLVDPDLSEATVTKATTDVATAVAPFLPANVRTAIYVGGGLVGVIGGAAAAIVGGQLGEAFAIIASAATALTGVTALSHVTK